MGSRVTGVSRYKAVILSRGSAGHEPSENNFSTAGAAAACRAGRDGTAAPFLLAWLLAVCILQL